MEVKLERLKRFDTAKHEQLEGLLQWCQLMGLTGKDLVSLGGHIDRLQARQAVEQNLAICQGIQIDPVGKDNNTNTRWSIKTSTGRYKFELGSYYEDITITSYATKVKKRYQANRIYELPRMDWRKRTKYQALLDYHYGIIQLDF